MSRFSGAPQGGADPPMTGVGYGDAPPLPSGTGSNENDSALFNPRSDPARFNEWAATVGTQPSPDWLKRMGKIGIEYLLWLHTSPADGGGYKNDYGNTVYDMYGFMMNKHLLNVYADVYDDYSNWYWSEHRDRGYRVPSELPDHSQYPWSGRNRDEDWSGFDPDTDRSGVPDVMERRRYRRHRRRGLNQLYFRYRR